MTATGPATYSFSMRTLHWLRAFLIMGLLAAGLLMVHGPDSLPGKYTAFYPNHKQFGVLALILTVVQLILRSLSQRPAYPAGLHQWEKTLSHTTQTVMYMLMIIVPLMGYSMSSSFTQSDGVPFFFTQLPELLPKNDNAFVVFQALHKYLAYTLMGLITLHVAGALKHRLLDKNPSNDVLKHML